MPTIAADQYTRFMIELFDEREIIGVPLAFQSFFGNPASGGSRTVISPDVLVSEIDIIRGNGEKLAPMVNRGTLSDTITRQKNIVEEKFTNTAREFPLIEMESNLNSNQLLLRLPGENPYQGRTRIDRNRERAMQEHREHIRESVRTFELLCRDSIMTGQHAAILGTTNADLIYDFYRDPALIITVGTAWSTGSADILKDIDDTIELVREKAYVFPDFLALGRDAMDAFIKDTTVQTLADNRRFELIQVSENLPVPPRFKRHVDAGWVAYGRLRTPAGHVVWIFTNNDIYTDSAGDPQRYLPADQGFMAYSGARCDRYFGPPDSMPPTSDEAAWFQELFGFDMMSPPMSAQISNSGGIILPQMFYTDGYRGKGRKSAVIRTQSAPIFPTTQTDAFATLLGLSV